MACGLRDTVSPLGSLAEVFKTPKAAASFPAGWEPAPEEPPPEVEVEPEGVPEVAGLSSGFGRVIPKFGPYFWIKDWMDAMDMDPPARRINPAFLISESGAVF